MDQHLTAILRIGLAFDEITRFHPIYKFDGGVMANLETAGNLADGRGNGDWQAFHGKHKLMLMRLQSMRSGGILRVMKESPNMMPEVGKGAIEGRLCLQIIS